MLLWGSDSKHHRVEFVQFLPGAMSRPEAGKGIPDIVMGQWGTRVGPGGWQHFLKKKKRCFLTQAIYHIFSVIRLSVFIPKQSQKSRSIL